MGFKTVGQIYKIPVGAAIPGTAIALPEIAQVVAMKMRPVISLEAVGCGIVFKMSNVNTVAASDVADGAGYFLGSGNQHIVNGAVENFDVLSTDAYISLLSDDHTATGTLWLSIGYEVRPNIN